MTPKGIEKVTAQVRKIRSLAVAGEPGVCEAGKYIHTDLMRRKQTVEGMNYDVGCRAILNFTQYLLARDAYSVAALLLWGDDQFTIEPRSVQMIWTRIPQVSEMIIMGASAMGKSYSVGAWFFLDWLQDPEWTCIKVLSTSEEHAKRNVFAHMRNLHSRAIIPLPGRVLDKSIQVNKDDKQGIHLLSIPAGDSGKGRLRGFHPEPRPVEHRKFGRLSRVRALLDECEEIPEGVWEDIDNMLSTKEGVENVKVVGATNPKDRNSKVGSYCEPKDGWESVAIEDSEEWTSRLGWHVMRLDAAKCENVIQRKVVYPGLQTWDGYKKYLAHGDNSPEYFTYARGWFPEQGLAVSVIPQAYLQRAKGMFIFAGKVIFASYTDLAFGGGDLCIMTIGRYGHVLGWTPMNGSPVMFPQTGKPRWGLQIDQQIEIVKTDTWGITQKIISINRDLRIKPGMTGVDKTGVGLGVHDMLCQLLPSEFQGQTGVEDHDRPLGIHYGEASTKLHVMDDNSDVAEDIYDGIVTELFFVGRVFMEFDIMKISPSVPLVPLARELTDRRFKQARKDERVRVESKDEYKARGNKSPDHADSLLGLVHVVRVRTPFAASMLALDNFSRVETHQRPGIVDNPQFLDFNT